MRPAALVRLALGGVCLASPGPVLTAVGADDRDDPTIQLLTQVLGARMVLQGAAGLVLGPRTRRIDVTVEGLHAASMVPAAVVWPEHRRSAAVSAAAAVATALLDLATR